MTHPAADSPSRVSLRPRYRPGQVLDEVDLVDERESRDRSMRLHRLSAHGFGILSGLEVTVNDDWLSLSPGAAVDGFGFELVVPEPKAWPLSEFSGPARRLSDPGLDQPNPRPARQVGSGHRGRRCRAPVPL